MNLSNEQVDELVLKHFVSPFHGDFKQDMYHFVRDIEAGVKCARCEELETELKIYSTRAANRLIGLCKCGEEREKLQDKLAAAENIMAEVEAFINSPITVESCGRFTTLIAEYKKGEKA